MALVDGLFWKPSDPLSFRDFILGICAQDQGIQELIAMKKKRALELINGCLDQGAQGIIIGDDLAYNGGPFASPDDLGGAIAPGLQELVHTVKESKKPVFLHSCGNVGSIIQWIIACGFDGLHGLASTAGNDPLAIRRVTRGRLTLMGIFDLDGQKPEAIRALKKEILGPMSMDGGYILGSAAGLSVYTPLESFKALYS
jgi:uroporphyrinogen decarboxylase